MSRCFLGVLMHEETLHLALISRRLRQTRLVDCLRIERFRSRPQPELGTEIKFFLSKNKAAGCRSVLVMPRGEFVVRKLDLPVEAQANLAKVVEYQVANIVPSEDATVCYDFFATKVGKDARSIGVTVFVLLRSVVEAKLQSCQSLGLEIEKVVPSSAVLASCLESFPQKTLKPTGALGYAIGQRGEFVSFSDGRFYQAQDLACSSGEELWEDLQREARIFRSQAQVPDETPLDVFLFSPLHRIWEQETEDRLLKIYPIRNLTQLGFNRGKTTLDANEVQDEFLPAMAAATSFRRGNPYAINLLPAEKRSQKSRWLWVPAYVLAGVNLILLLLLALLKPIQLEMYSRQLQREVRRLEPEVRKIRQVETEMDIYQKRAEFLTNFTASTVTNVGTLNELSKLLPRNSWITSFGLKDQVVEIIGMSDEASGLLQVLDNSPYFKNAEFTAPITRDSLGKEVFRIRMRVEAPPVRSVGPAQGVKPMASGNGAKEKS
jgi:Tfp pilus assembly protein PilN